MTSDEQSEQIEQVAWQLFTQQGYGAVRMDDIASELRISKKTLYMAVHTKEGLLIRLVRQRLKAADTATAFITDDDERDSREKLQALLQYALSQLTSVQPRLLHDIRRQIPYLWREIEETRDRIIHDRVGAVIQEGMASGELRDDLETSQVTAILFHSLRGVITGNINTTDPLQFAHLLETTITILYDGIKVRGD